MEHPTRVEEQSFSEAPAPDELRERDLPLRADALLSPSPGHSSLTFRTLVSTPGIREGLERVRQFVSAAPKSPPVLLWGGGGVGKTHLLSAAAQALDRREPALRVWWGNGGLLPRSEGRADVLILDDLHLVSGTRDEQALLELMGRTTTALFAADCPPHEMRIRSRALREALEAVDPVVLEGPDFEARLELLWARRNSAARVPGPALECLAAAMPADTRRLLAAWDELLARADRLDTAATAELAAEVASLYRDSLR